MTLAITVGLLFGGYDIFPIDFSTLPLTIIDHVTNTRSLAYLQRDIYSNRYYRFTNDGKVGTWDRGTIVDSLEVIFESTNGDIFSSSNMEELKSIEDRIQNLTGFQDICLTISSGQCDKPWSVLRLFDGTYSSVDSSFLASTYDNSTDIFCKAYTNNATSNFVKIFLENNYNPCDATTSATSTRIFFHFGLTTTSGQKGKRLTFQTDYFKPLIHHIAEIEVKDIMNIYYYSLELFVLDASEQAMADMWWGAGSYLFIFIVMWLQTASLWITFLGLYSIITSYLIANIIYRYCLGYVYFGFFHMAAMFIIIGIGADDVFVFYDTWRLTANTKYPTKAHRLSDFYQKAAKTTFITSLTTTLAFLVTSISPLLAVKTFGLFSALLVAVNYIFDLIYFPTAVMLYSEKVKPFADDKLIKCYTWLKRLCRKFCRRKERVGSSTEIDESKKKYFSDRNKIMVFFRTKFHHLVMTKAARIGVPIFFVIFSIFFIYWATRLEVSTGSVRHLIL